MPVTILDLVVIGVMLISALLAMLRGFTREVLAIASWGLAAVVAYLFYPQIVPHLSPYIPSTNPAVLNGTAGAALFLGTLVVAYVVTSKLSDVILDSRVGALDRTLGFVFGAARGFLLMIVAYGFFNFLMAGKQEPTWVADSKLKPFLIEASQSLIAMLPADVTEQLSNAIRRPPADQGLTPPQPQAGTGQ